MGDQPGRVLEESRHRHLGYFRSAGVIGIGLADHAAEQGIDRARQRGAPEVTAAQEPLPKPPGPGSEWTEAARPFEVLRRDVFAADGEQMPATGRGGAVAKAEVGRFGS